MSFRRRVTLLSAAAVAIAVVLASVLTYLLASHLLRGQIDSQLRERSAGLPSRRFLVTPGSVSSTRSTTAGERELRHAVLSLLDHASHGHGRELQRLRESFLHMLEPTGKKGAKSRHNPLGNLPPRPDEVRGYQQLISSAGKVVNRSTDVTLPVSARTRRLAAKGGRSFFADARVKGIDMRILAESLPQGGAVQLAQPLTDVDHLLSHLRLILALLDIGGVALAALLGRLVSGAAVSPVRRLTQAIEHVTRTQDLSRRIQPGGEDEIGRLAVEFNAMMDALGSSMRALDASVDAQRQLVADASHELRTPVTSLRTNIEILQRADDMERVEHERLLADVVEQTEELTSLVNDLIDLARGEQAQADVEDVRLDLVVGEAIERARRNSPGTVIEGDLSQTVLAGIPERLGRAVNNLIENAVKYSAPGAAVEVVLRPGELTIRDHGSGICAQDLPHVFDRFFRGREARGRPGSGLGLAIVRQVVEQHGGTVAAEQAPGGGALMRVTLPGSEPVEEPPRPRYTAV